ncbi:MAG: WYL domain-containing protein [Actinomycetota bacterium]|nr:WYL domain-containing protein [Actinomycetota bacterium]MDZ4179564.1 WYL domain-containing protein [Coriobacteriia bacterium]
MAEATERIINLALVLAAARGSVDADRIRRDVAGYPPPETQDEEAFKRMLERDKEHLRDAGFSIESDAEGNYRLDAAATFAAPLQFSAAEKVLVRAVGTAMLDDPSFPFAEDLHIALAKLAETDDPTIPAVTARGADEDPGYQAETVASLAGAVSSAKRVSFDYTNSLGQDKHHEVEPYGLFARDGRWYLVGRDTEIDETRTYTVARARRLSVNVARPKSPDFVRPQDFRVETFVRQPFQYGSDDLTVTIDFDPGVAWRADALLGAGPGEERDGGESSVRRTVHVRDRQRLLRWLVENGPGLSVVSPPDLAEELRSGLTLAVEAHGGDEHGTDLR